MIDKTDNMLILYKKIKYNRVNKRHRENLLLINEYLKNGHSVFDWLLETYIISLIKCNKYDEAKKYIGVLVKCFPNFLSNCDMTCFYILMEDYGKVFEIINDTNISLSDVDYLKLGIKLLSNCQYNIANDCFIKAKELTNHSQIKHKCEQCMKQISDHFENNAFVCQTYKQFEDSNNTILPGYIITGYVNNKSDKYGDLRKFNRRSHIIIEINDGKAYCLPLLTFDPYVQSNRLEFKKNMLLKEDYTFLDRDYLVTDKIESIDLDKIYLVYGRVLPEDYYDIYNMVTTSREDYINSKRLFKIKK